jgi:hypothetical protein
VWRIEHDVVNRETRAVTSYGGTTEAGDLRTEERYEGTVGVSTEDPGRAWVDARAANTLHFPEATISGEARWRIVSDRDAYGIRVELDTSEDGEPRWSRRWERRIPRKLQ